jgi:DNA topoisomerase-3
MSAADSLRTAQSLYERQLITYPRTDSRYLSSDMRNEVTVVLRKLQSLKPHEIGKLDLASLRFSGRIVNNQKVTDHHAILPTGTVPESLAGREQKVYDAIVVRLIAAFYPPCLKEVTTVEGTANEVPFRARGVRIASPGWTELYPRNSEKRDGEEEQFLPEFSCGESGSHEPFIKQGQTTPPQHFTENTLLGAMETAGKLVEEADLREALKEKGLGTPATRASIIETLLKRRYLTRQKKNLLATDLGRYLVAMVRDQNLKSPELTGEWEAKLNRIAAGQAAPEAFMREIAEYTQRIVRSSDELVIDDERLGDCPRCGQPVIAGKRAFGCSAWREGCPFVLESTYKDCDLDLRQIRALLQHRVTSEPIQLGGGQRYVLTLSDSGALVEIPVPQGDEQSRRNTGQSKRGRSPSRKTSTARSAEQSVKQSSPRGVGICPLCGAPVVEQNKSFSCSRWRDGCTFTIWKTIAGKRLSARTAQALLRDRTTSRLKGFKSKSRQPFSARLTLRDGKVCFDFDS